MAHVISSRTLSNLPDNSSSEDINHSDLHISDEAALTFTWSVYGVLCPIIGIFGTVTNIINIICFVKQDFEDTVNVSLLGKKIISLFTV